MIPHRDEILRPAVSTDATAVPRYNLVRPDGTISEKNVAMRLSNPVAREGTPISKAALDEMLAASGVTAGTATAYTLAQEEYTLFDGAPVRFRLHTASGDGATLNINGTGAKPLRDMIGEPMAGGIPAGTWLTAYYSAAAGAYVLVGGEAVRALYGERYTADDAVAYIKDAPGDALPYAEVTEIGGMTYKVNVGTEANPVYELRSAATTEMKSVGVNLIPYPYTDTSKTINGITFWDNGDGSIIVSGTATSQAEFVLLGRTSEFAGNELHVSGGYAACQLVVINYSNNNVYDYGDGATCMPDGDVEFWLVVPKGTTINNRLIIPMVNKGARAQPYTPYFHDTLPIPEAVRALNGIPGGAYDCIYWDKDGKRKKRQSVKKVVFDGSEDEVILRQGLEGNYALWELKTGGGYDYSIAITDSNLEYRIGFDMRDAHYYVNKSAVIVSLPAEIATDVASLRAHLAENPMSFCYELATPIITDISDILPGDNIVRVQPGGTITAVNEYGFAVPTKITYQRDVLANRASTFEAEKLRREMESAEPPDVSGAISAAISAHKSESAAHNAASIVTDSTHRFVTDAEKAAWNAGGGGSAKIISNTRLASATASVTVNLPMEYTYLRIILSEAATTSTAFGYIRGALNVDTISTGMAVSANNSGGAEITSSTSSGYAFETHFYGNRAYGYIVLDLVRYPDAGMAKGTCFWSNDGGGDDQYAITGSLVISAGGEPTTLTISSGTGHSIKNGMGILVMGVK